MDKRKAPINGTLDKYIRKDGEEKLIYFGGKSFDNDTRDDRIWEFEGNKWKELDIKLPPMVVENATKIVAAPPNFC